MISSVAAAALHHNEAWQQAAAPGLEFAKHRTANRGLLQLVVRAWRERVEHDSPGICTDASRWIVRKRQPQPQSRLRRRITQQLGQNQFTGEDQKFCSQQIASLDLLAQDYKWTPWQSADQKPTARPIRRSARAPPPEPTEIERRWKLRDKCLRVATYYRVMHSHARAERQAKSSRVKARFRAWATSWLAERKAEREHQGRHAGAAETERQRRGEGGDQPSAHTRMETKGPDVYRAGTRRYRPRVTRDERDRRLIRKKGRRIPSTVSAVIGPRLYENMTTIAKVCADERQGQG